MDPVVPVPVPNGRRRLIPSRLGRWPAVATLAALAALTFPLVKSNVKEPWFLCEFRGDLYVAGQNILHGVDPYRPDYIAAQARVKRDGGNPVTNFILPVYPAPTLVVAAPLSLLPFGVAGMLYLVLAIASLILSLRVLEVRDPRCLAAMVVSIPALLALIDGTISPVLMLGAALAWRCRDHVRRCGAAVASVVVAKLFLWPLLAWMLITGRLRAFRAAVVIGVAIVVVGWALIGFAGLTGYPHMLANLNYVEADVGVSLVAGLHAVGLADSGANVLALVVAAAILACAGILVRKPDGQRRAFALAVMAALIATPISWPNYLVLVYVPIALVSPGFSSLWLVPLLAYAAPETQTHGNLLEIVPTLIIEAAVLGRLLWPKPFRRQEFPGAGRQMHHESDRESGSGVDYRDSLRVMR